SAGFGVLVLIAPEAGKGGSGAPFKQLCALPTCNSACFMKALFCGNSITSGDEQIAANAMHVRLAPAFLRCLRLLNRLVELFEPFSWPTCVPKSARMHGEKEWNARDGPSGADIGQGFREEFQAFVNATRRRQAPSANAERKCRPIREGVLGAQRRQFL